MADQPEALRLANLIDHGNDSSWIEREAAAELRRLVAENTLLHERHHFDNGVLKELLEALKDLTTAQDLNAYGMALHNARAAIAKAEGEKT
jgi:hypothetical protein